MLIARRRRRLLLFLARLLLLLWRWPLATHFGRDIRLLCRRRVLILLALDQQDWQHNHRPLKNERRALAQHAPHGLHERLPARHPRQNRHERSLGQIEPKAETLAVEHQRAVALSHRLQLLRVLLVRHFRVVLQALVTVHDAPELLGLVQLVHLENARREHKSLLSLTFDAAERVSNRAHLRDKVRHRRLVCVRILEQRLHLLALHHDHANLDVAQHAQRDAVLHAQLKHFGAVDRLVRHVRVQHLVPVARLAAVLLFTAAEVDLRRRRQKEPLPRGHPRVVERHLPVRLTRRRVTRRLVRLVTDEQVERPVGRLVHATALADHSCLEHLVEQLA